MLAGFAVPLVPVLLGQTRVEFIYQTFQSQTSAGTTSFTFPSVPFGPVDPSRVVVVAYYLRGLTGVPSVQGGTINGGAASSYGDIEISTVSTATGFIGRKVVTGATGSVGITTSSMVVACGISVYALYGTASAASFANSSKVITSSGTTSISVPSNGGAIGALLGSNSAVSLAWTGATVSTEGAVGTALRASSAVVSNPANVGSAFTVTDGLLSLVSFAPAP